MDGRRAGLSCLGATMFGLFVLSGCAGHTIGTGLTAAEMRSDLEYLGATFPERERSFTTATLALFRERLAALSARADTLSQNQFVMGLQWAVAAADNGHTEALVHEHQRLRLPLDLRWFADGLYVVAARPGYEDLLGAGVLAIEGRTPGDLLTLLNEYVGGTPEHVRVISNLFLERPELLHGIGVAAKVDATSLTLVLPNGQNTTRRVPGIPGEGTARAADALHALDGLEALPLYLREPDQTTYLQWMPPLDAAYIRISRNHGDGLRQGLARILDEVERLRPRHFIVDLRLNRGGNYELTADFARALPKLIPPNGRLLLVTGHETFSAAIVSAAILKSGAGERTTIVGERVGDDLQWWSEAEALVLPNSALRVHYTDGFHDWRNGYLEDDPRYRFNRRQAAMNQRYSAAAGSLEPDVRVPLTFADYVAGRDPVMAAIESLLGSMN